MLVGGRVFAILKLQESVKEQMVLGDAKHWQLQVSCHLQRMAVFVSYLLDYFAD
jgi:hypothetical protein